jgi:hypothetical protein
MTHDHGANFAGYRRGVKSKHSSIPDSECAVHLGGDCHSVLRGRYGFGVATKQAYKSFSRGVTSHVTRALAKGGSDTRGWEQAADANLAIQYYQHATDLRAAAAKNFERADAIEDSNDTR